MAKSEKGSPLGKGVSFQDQCELLVVRTLILSIHGRTQGERVTAELAAEMVWDRTLFAR